MRGKSVSRGSVVAALSTALAAAALSAAPAGALGPGGWDSLGPGLNDSVFALNTDIPGQLLVGGRFTDAGGNVGANQIASWDGTNWNSVGPPGSLTGTATFVSAIAVDNGRVFAGGTFPNAGGNATADNLAMWDGASWQPFCFTPSGPVDALEVVGPILYVGGSFSNANGVLAADNLVKCELATGAFLGATVDNDGDISGRVESLTSDASGNLYAGGTFSGIDGIPGADYVAMYNGTSWSRMGPPAAVSSLSVDSLASDGTNVYIGADDVDIAGIPQADHVARWDGVNWNAVGANTAGTDGYFPGLAAINGLLATGTSLYVTGNFADANGDPLADQIAVFDGTSWNHLGSSADGTNGPFIGQGHDVAIFGGRPIAGGAFTDASGDLAADRIAAFGPAGGGGTLPAPVQGVAVNIAPVSGTVTVDIKGDTAGFIPLAEATQVPVGSKVDTTKGRVALTSATKTGGTQTADFYDGLFQIKQTTKNDLTTARLRGKQQCGGASGAGSDRNPVASRRRKPKLWGSGSGNFSSSGNHGSASVRGTTWLIFEQCGGITGTTVKEGKVAFKNFYTGKTKVVKAPKTALAKPPAKRNGR